MNNGSVSGTRNDYNLSHLSYFKYSIRVNLISFIILPVKILGEKMILAIIVLSFKTRKTICQSDREVERKDWFDQLAERIGKISTIKSYILRLSCYYIKTFFV